MTPTKTPAKEFNLHSLAKKAKHRLSGNYADEKPSYASQTSRLSIDDYCKVLKMVLSPEPISNPVARFIGKDLSNIPNSSEKQKLVFDTISRLDALRNHIKTDASKASRENRFMVIDNNEYDPNYILERLN